MSSNLNGIGYLSGLGMEGHHIFVPSKGICFTEHGYMAQQKKPNMSAKVWDARCKAIKNHETKEVKRQIKQQAAQESQKAVSVPSELVEEIDSYVTDLKQLRALQEKIEKNKAALQAKITSSFWKMYGDPEPGTLVLWKDNQHSSK